MPVFAVALCVTYLALVASDLGDLLTLALHPGHQSVQFLLQVLPDLGVGRLTDLVRQLLVLTVT